MAEHDDPLVDTILDGLVTVSELVGDPELISQGATMCGVVRDEFGAEIAPGDRCLLAFPSILIDPKARIPCFIGIFDDRIVVAWNSGVLRKIRGAIVMNFVDIEAIRGETGTTAGTRGASLMVIEDAETELTVALPVRRGQALLAAVNDAVFGIDPSDSDDIESDPSDTTARGTGPHMVEDPRRLAIMVDDLRSMRENCEPKSSENPRYQGYSAAISALRSIIADL